MRNKRSSKPKKTSNRVVSAVICVMVIAICIGFSIRSRSIKAANEENNAKIEELQSQIADEEARKDELDRYSKYVNTKQFVEEMARKKLGLIYPGEIIFKGE